MIRTFQQSDCVFLEMSLDALVAHITYIFVTTIYNKLNDTHATIYRHYNINLAWDMQVNCPKPSQNMCYPYRLLKLSSPTLRFRRLRGDMIETYKLLKNIYDSLLPALKGSTTRGHSLKVLKERAETTIKAHSFTHRIVYDWKSLHEHAISAPSINAFKNRLDAFRKNHPWLYDWDAVIDDWVIP